jgi:hypothetical protein
MQENQDKGIADLNLNSFVQENYLPVLDENLINNNRFANCHLLPKALSNLFQKLDIYI